MILKVYPTPDPTLTIRRFGAFKLMIEQGYRLCYDNNNCSNLLGGPLKRGDMLDSHLYVYALFRERTWNACPLYVRF